MRSLLLCFIIITAYGQFNDENGETGYITIDKAKDGTNLDLFYWIFYSRSNKPDDPLILWLEGGPGCSALICIFGENGPYRFDDNGTIINNTESWNNNAHLLYIDQPLDTGYSNCSDISRIPEDEEGASQDFMIFLEKFFEKHADMRDRDFYVTGQSYAGHYVPYFTTKILKRQQSENKLPLKLKGVAIGNGFFKGTTQALTYAKFNKDHNLYDRPLSYLASSLVYKLTDLFGNMGWLTQAFIFFELGRRISNGVDPRFNMYNYKMEKGYNRVHLMALANGNETRKIMGVGERSWVGCSQNVMLRMIAKDFFADMTPYFQEIVKSSNSLRVILYNGELDWICNTDGVIRYLKEVSWEGKEEFFKQDWISHSLDENNTMEFKKVNEFYFYKVYEAGHMISVERPKIGTYLVDKLLGRIP